MNQLHIIGNLTRDPDTRTTTSGKQVCQFSVAVNSRTIKDHVDYFRVQAWNGLADVCGKYLAKGRKVAVTGSVSLNTYTTNNGENRAEMVVHADDVEFLTPKAETASEAVKTPKTDKQSGFVKVEDEEMPF